MKAKISKAILTIFVVAGIGFSIYIAANALIQGSTQVVFERSSKLSMPPSYPDYHLERSTMLMKKIQSDKHYLDSLSIHDTILYRKILKANPRIIENIQILETLFVQHIKK